MVVVLLKSSALLSQLVLTNEGIFLLQNHKYHLHFFGGWRESSGWKVFSFVNLLLIFSRRRCFGASGVQLSLVKCNRQGGGPIMEI
jgi:hypothetical protein